MGLSWAQANCAAMMTASSGREREDFMPMKRSPGSCGCVVSGFDARADGDQFAEPVDRLARHPTKAAKREQAVKGIVEGPVVMAGDAHEDAPAAVLARPDLRTLLAVLGRAGDELHACRITDQIPIRLIDEVQRRKTLNERMRQQREIDGTVPKLAGAFGDRVTDALGELRAV